MRFVYWLKQPAVVRDSEMETLQRWLNDYTGEALEVVGLEPGGRARIESGALMGRDAAVVERRGNRLVLFLESLDLEVQVDLRQTKITAADEPAPEEL